MSHIPRRRALRVGLCLLALPAAGAHAHAAPAASPPIIRKKTTRPPAGAAPEIISVIGRRPGRSIVAKASSAATKTDTPLIDTPESVSTVTRQQMDLQNARTLTEALRYSSGVSTSPAGVIGRHDVVSIRGFGGNGLGIDEYLDGLKLFNGAYIGNQQIDPYLLERIDVLKGPPSVVYGQSNPGGVIALTSKLPDARDIHALSLEGGSYDYVRGTGDFGGKLDQGGHVLYRLAATGTAGRSLDLHTRTQRLAVMPSVAWVPSDRLALTITGFYQTDPYGGDYGLVPLEGTILPNPNGRLSRHVYEGDQNYDQFTRQQAAIGYQFRYRIDKNWSLRSTARYAHVHTTQTQILGYGLAPDDLTLTRYAGANREAFDTMTVEEQVLGHVETGPLHHAILFGVGWQNLRDSYDYFNALTSSIDIFDPINVPGRYDPPLASDMAATTNQEGLFAEDQMDLGHWHAQIGARQDWSGITTRDHILGGAYDVTNHAFTWRGGLLYHVDRDMSVYFNYAESFQPVTTLSQSGAPFKPSRGHQEEVGWKYSPHSFTGFIAAALFDLQETNVLTTDPTNFLFSVQTGGIRSQGVELEAHANLTRDLSTIIAYTYLHQVYNRASGALTGERPVQIPAQTVSAWARYQFHDGRLRSLGASLGVRYTGDTIADPTTEIATPAYTVFDAEADYDLEALTPHLRDTHVQLTAQNLTNRRYVSSCVNDAFGCYIGAPRTVIGKVSVQW